VGRRSWAWSYLWVVHHVRLVLSGYKAILRLSYSSETLPYTKIKHHAVVAVGKVEIVGRGGIDVVVEFESLQYNRPATSLIIQSIPPSNPAPVTAEQEWIAHL
jgi:hypothetical protein